MSSLRLEHQGLNSGDKFHEFLGLSRLNRYPNIPILGGTVIIALMVVVAFANEGNSEFLIYGLIGYRLVKGLRVKLLSDLLAVIS